MTSKENFEIFWNEYPRKVGKGACRKIWERKKFSDEVLNKMLETITWQKKLIQWQDPTYIPHPSTWLNQERWEDEKDDKLLVGSVAVIEGNKTYPKNARQINQDQRDELLELMNSKTTKMFGKGS